MSDDNQTMVEGKSKSKVHVKPLKRTTAVNWVNFDVHRRTRNNFFVPAYLHVLCIYYLVCVQVWFVIKTEVEVLPAKRVAKFLGMWRKNPQRSTREC